MLTHPYFVCYHGNTQPVLEKQPVYVRFENHIMHETEVELSGYDAAESCQQEVTCIFKGLFSEVLR